MERKALGKGLSALIPERESEQGIERTDKVKLLLIEEGGLLITLLFASAG